MSRYYGFNINEIGDMSVYQFGSYLGEIAEIEKIFSGGEDNEEKKPEKSNAELVERARKKGFITPLKY